MPDPTAEPVEQPDVDSITIPVPLVAPLGVKLDKKEYVQEVWDVYVKPDQEMELPQSSEMRMLMAILRAVYRGLQEAEEKGKLTSSLDEFLNKITPGDKEVPPGDLKFD